MQIYQKLLPVSLPYQFSTNKSIRECDILLFDIETTGLSADISSIYLIGCCYYQNQCWNMIQYFADDYISEKSLLQSFIDLAKNFKVMIHFNGTGFDIPYMQKKLMAHQLDFSFDSFLQLDLYRKIFPYKRILNLTNTKQKTIESFLGFVRNDPYSGGELIEVYVEYMKNKFGHKPAMQDNLDALLLHNEEDVCNLILLTSVLAYSDLFEEPLEVIGAQFDGESVTISFYLRNPLKTGVSYTTKGQDITLIAEENTGQISVLVYQGILKYFYPNYKDYYYLPAEDTAIHKSVAAFVEKEYREKAKAATCYTKKDSVFLPQYFGDLSPAFRFGHKDKTSYIEVTPSFLENKEQCQDYLKSLMLYLVKQSGSSSHSRNLS